MNETASEDQQADGCLVLTQTEPGCFAVLHWFLQTLKSQSKYSGTLHNAPGDS